MPAGPSPVEAPVPAAADDRVAPSVAPPTLRDAVAGGCYAVVEVLGRDALARRLASAGLWPGARLELLARAPFGDPLLFRVHGYRLALRRSEAERVLVTAVEGGA